jgi:DNA-directed RNA polymerase subunit beta'
MKKENWLPIIDTTVGRVLFNEVVPEAAGYFNDGFDQKNLREIIGDILESN